MDVGKELKNTIVHLDLESYLVGLEQGKYPARILESRLLEDFEYGGQKFSIQLELFEEKYDYPDDDFEKIISSNPSYIKKLMQFFEQALSKFQASLQDTFATNPDILKHNKSLILQSYLTRMNQKCSPPDSIKSSNSKAIFFRHFCQQVAQAYIANRRPEHFKQFAATIPSNLHRMRRIVNYLSLKSLSKRQLYQHFIVNEDFIHAHTLTLMPESDLRMKLLTKLTDTYNHAVTILHRDKKDVFENDSEPVNKIGTTSKKVTVENFEPVAVDARLTIDELLKHILHLLKFVINEVKHEKGHEIIAVFRGNQFFSQEMHYQSSPDVLIFKIQEHLERVYLIEGGPVQKD